MGKIVKNFFFFLGGGGYSGGADVKERETENLKENMHCVRSTFNIRKI